MTPWKYPRLPDDERCETDIVVLALGVARCQLRKGHEGDHDTDVWDDDAAGSWLDGGDCR